MKRPLAFPWLVGFLLFDVFGSTLRPLKATASLRYEISNVTEFTAPISRHYFDGPVADDRLWESSVSRGCLLVSMMSSTDQVAAEMFTPPLGDTAVSKLREYRDFVIWGYSDDPMATLHNFRFNEDDSPILPALETLKINTRTNGETPPNRVIGWVHNRETIHEDKTYKVSEYINITWNAPLHSPTTTNRATKSTGGRFYTVVNARDGMLVGWFKFSPTSQAPRQRPALDPKKDLMPALQRWSDVAYLQWADQATKANVPIDSLRYIFSSPVENEESQSIIARALLSGSDVPEWKLPPWEERQEFSMDTEGRALLGSPNGRGAALLLIQHKDTMGERSTIEKVTVFGDSSMNLLFYVKRV